MKVANYNLYVISSVDSAVTLKVPELQKIFHFMLQLMSFWCLYIVFYCSLKHMTLEMVFMHANHPH